ncbi:sigma-70 family RNA polymerase sigma factor [Paenisporosarcina antarctica]|uniref:Sigma-70 family RNA polymerase sigma factor n=1 Tax=Paenisporosarcina antarctica TaxID=417367 RepID=A0A4P6ZWG6_9BACL|nr:sigma-70 family RNA polymerase sigma factor [Paenisporosarcina antarctica]QBP40554.1 sigma-70 family RNA polymerase sigma factor [Paenisporosarcina antarctica]
MKDSYNQSIETYLSKIEKHMKNPIIKSFLNIAENMDLLKEVINNPTSILTKKLDDTFREFYFRIRFTSYLSQAIYFNAINYDKKVKLFSDRNKSILDIPIKDKKGRTVIEFFCSMEWKDYQEDCIYSSNIKDHLTNDSLYKGIEQLTENQRQLLSLAYIFDLTDSEIATYFNVSQQAVSKSHKKILKKLREIIKNG